MVSKTLIGEVSAVSASGLAVLTERSRTQEKEIWFPVDSSVKLSRVGSIKKLQEGDVVEVTYQEAKDGSKRRATRVTFISPKKPEPVVLTDETIAGEENPSLLRSVEGPQ